MNVLLTRFDVTFVITTFAQGDVESRTLFLYENVKENDIPHCYREH